LILESKVFASHYQLVVSFNTSQN